MQLRFTIGATEYALTAEPLSGGVWQIDGLDQPVVLGDVRLLPGNAVEFALPIENGASRVLRLPFAQVPGGTQIGCDGRVLTAAPVQEAAVGRRKSRAASGSLTAPMTGVVAEVLVQPGDRVEAGQALMVVEAMKVMATIEAPLAGTVAAVHFTKGEVIAHGAVAIDLQPEGDAAP